MFERVEARRGGAQEVLARGGGRAGAADKGGAGLEHEAREVPARMVECRRRSVEGRWLSTKPVRPWEIMRDHRRRRREAHEGMRDHVRSWETMGEYGSP